MHVDLNVLSNDSSSEVSSTTESRRFPATSIDRFGVEYVRGIAGKHIRKTIKDGFVKQGEVGLRVPLVTNYFYLNKDNPIVLLQHHVEFYPEVDNTLQRKKFVRTHEEVLGSYIFDGHMLYKSEPLPKDPYNIKTIEGGNEISIRIRKVGQVNPTDHMYYQFYNIVMRKCLVLLGMEEIGRHFYDREREKTFKKEKLQLWPGVITAIKQHDSGPLLCVEVTHKVLRTSPVSDMMSTFKRTIRDKREYVSLESLLNFLILL